jgi:DNA modification methylase
MDLYERQADPSDFVKEPLFSEVELGECWRSRLDEHQRTLTARVTQPDADVVSTLLDERTTLVRADALVWLRQLAPESIHAVVTDPPYSLIEYADENHRKLRNGHGGVWRIPPAFDGSTRSPLPRFTVLSEDDRLRLEAFFTQVARELLRALVPGGHVFIASNPLLSTSTFGTFLNVGFEKRGEIIRVVQTLRGGDRPKGAHEEFPDITVMPRSCWEPWGLFRKPLAGTVADNLRRWGTGALRRKSSDEPFKDLIACSPTRSTERAIAPHPSLKPQRFLRQVVRAALPLGHGIVLDPFAGSGSTLAAAASMGYLSIGIEKDEEYFKVAVSAFERLRDLDPGQPK